MSTICTGAFLCSSGERKTPPWAPLYTDMSTSYTDHSRTVHGRVSSASWMGAQDTAGEIGPGVVGFVPVRLGEDRDFCHGTTGAPRHRSPVSSPLSRRWAEVQPGLALGY